MNGNGVRALQPTGVPGVDRILFGGLPRRGVYLVGGEPGTGKTTFGLQYLIEGRRRGERCLYVTLSQDRRDLERIAVSHGFDLDGVEIEEVSLGRAVGERQTVLHTADIELSELMDTLQDALVRSRAERVVIDSIHELRLLSNDPLSYRRELLLLRDLVGQLEATALFIDYVGPLNGDAQLEALANGAVILSKETPPYGAAIRRFGVLKMRGHDFIGGHHDLKIRRGGLSVFPRVVPALTDETLTDENILSGIPALDTMLGGGLQPGTTCLVVGQSGTGKSTLCSVYARASADEGRGVAMFLFEERPQVFRRRSRDLGFPLERLERAGSLALHHFNPVEVSPGEFAQHVVDAVERDGARVVVIDSLSGYLGALPNGRDLLTQLHSLLFYLSRRNVLTILTLTVHGLLGGEEHVQIDSSYLADSAVLLRHHEDGAEVRRTVTVLKKRQGDHERAVRELIIGRKGVAVV